MIMRQGGILSRLKAANQRFNGLLGGIVPQNDAGGLLGFEDADQARRQGQLALGASLLQASGPSLTPSTFGSNLGGALMNAQVAQNQGLDSALQRQLLMAQIGHLQAPPARSTELGTITLESNGQQRTLRRIDPEVDKLLQGGWTEVKTPAAQINLDSGQKGRILTPEEKRAQGLDPNATIQLKANGDLDVLTKPTEGEQRNAYASQNLLALNDAANQVITDNPDFDPANLFEPGLLPGVGDYLASQPYRQFKSAADEWTTNVVFLRSGATAREDEKTSAFKNYWPQPLDDERTQANKELGRLEQMKRAYEAGRSANRIGSDEADQVLAEIDARVGEVQERIKSLPESTKNVIPDLPPLPKGFKLRQ